MEKALPNLSRKVEILEVIRSLNQILPDYEHGLILWQFMR